MSAFKKILVPFDDDMRSIGALEYAAMFASGMDAKIIAFHLKDPKDYHTKTEFQKDLSELVNSKLRPKLEDINKNYPDIRKIDFRVCGLEKPLHEHIIDFAKEEKVDFILLRSHGQPNDNDWEFHFKKTNAYKVVLGAECPVFTFTQIPTNAKMKNILVPIDLMEGSLFKMPIAIQLAAQFNATIHLISGSEHKEDFEESEKQINGIYTELKEMGIRVIRNDIVHHTLPEAIDEYTSEQDIDLIMIMSRPGFRWSDLWISPKAKRIISQSKIPVISMRSNKPFEAGL